jgi:hypothetical protein
MDFRQFLEQLQVTSSHSKWRLINGSIRAIDMTIEGAGFPADTITFVANNRFREQWSPTMFLEAAMKLCMPLDLAISIAKANDGTGDKWLRDQLLLAVGLTPSRN